MDLLFDLFEIVGAARGDDDMGAFLRQGEGGCCTDTAACTRNERQLTFKLHDQFADCLRRGRSPDGSWSRAVPDESERSLSIVSWSVSSSPSRSVRTVG